MKRKGKAIQRLSNWRLNSQRQWGVWELIYLFTFSPPVSESQARKVTADCKLWQLKLRSWQQNTTQAAGNQPTCLLSHPPSQPPLSGDDRDNRYFLLCMVALLSEWVSRMSLDVTDVSLLSAPFIWLHHRPDNCNLRLSNWLLSSEAEQCRGRGWNFLINNPSS